MTPDKILEIARRFDPYEPDFVMTTETMIALGQALLEEDRESSEEQISQLRMAMHDIYEVYAGCEGFGSQTGPEAYLQDRIKEMAYIAGEHKREWDQWRKRMTFEEWWNDAGWHTDFEDDLHEVWAAAQAAERERIKQIVRDVTEGRSNCNRLLERIAANEQRQDT